MTDDEREALEVLAAESAPPRAPGWWKRPAKTYAQREREELEKTAALLSKEHKVAVHIEPYGASSYYDDKEKRVVVGTVDMWKRSAEYYIGLLLHEIGHVNESDMTILAKTPATEHSMVNMLEDERVNARIADKYEGASTYLDAMHAPYIEGMERMLARPSIARTECIGGVPPDDLPELRNRTLALAYLDADGIRTTASTGVAEADTLAHQIAGYMRRARVARREDIPRMAHEVEGMLAQIYQAEVSEKSTQQGDGEGEGENDGEKDKKDMRQLLGGDMNPKWTGHSKRSSDMIYSQQDALAAPEAKKLATKLLRVLRENERTGYEGGKLRGSLDKSKIARTAIPSYRVYRKRLLPKGKRHAIEVVLDCSGSMWGRGRIERGMYGALLAVRAFRAMGYPAGLVLYGYRAASVLDPRDIYDRKAVQDRIDALTSAYYDSGDNQTHLGIAEALPRLLRAGIGREKVLLVITDGGLDFMDIRESRAAIEDARKKDGVHTRLLYVEDEEQGERILHDKSRERTVKVAKDIPSHCAELVRSVGASVL